MEMKALRVITITTATLSAALHRAHDIRHNADERLRVRAPDGSHRWVDVRAKEFIDAFGQRDGAIAACRPADEAVRTEARLQRMATFDTLTGLVKRLIAELGNKVPPEIVEKLL